MIYFDTKYVIRLERVQNRFLSYAAYLLIIEHPHHDYSQIRSKLKLNTPLLLNRRSEADLNFISSVLNGSIEVEVFFIPHSIQCPQALSTEIAQIKILKNMNIYTLLFIVIIFKWLQHNFNYTYFLSRFHWKMHTMMSSNFNFRKIFMTHAEVLLNRSFPTLSYIGVIITSNFLNLTEKQNPKTIIFFKLSWLTNHMEIKLSKFKIIDDLLNKETNVCNQNLIILGIRVINLSYKGNKIRKTFISIIAIPPIIS
ncbi:Uncharacterized protein FWK35_00005615 [Aphis craccivora]|uniref:Uncharacterized protein n=1 Tax=Aphis craccivora TaxID=307492 RepID=A0A6G0ZMX5_APHCR|nr:Uncharacterized protein FWK35_00005615 [Aphis craccivora]